MAICAVWYRPDYWIPALCPRSRDTISLLTRFPNVTVQRRRQHRPATAVSAILLRQTPSCVIPVIPLKPRRARPENLYSSLREYSAKPTLDRRRGALTSHCFDTNNETSPERPPRHLGAARYRGATIRRAT